MTNKFKDANDFEWVISFNIFKARKIKEKTGLDLLKVEDVLEKASEDMYGLCEAVWISIEEQATAKGITEQDFYNSLSGESIEAMSNAFIEALVFFSPNQNTKIVIKKSQEMIKTEQAKMTKALTELDYSELLTDGN